MCELHTQARRVDPTMTTTLRNRFEADMKHRFRAIQAAVLHEVGEQDGFGLVVNRGRFDRGASAIKLTEFMKWLREAQDQGLLDMQPGTPMASAASRSWMNIYLASAYQKGLARAAQQLRAGGAKVESRWVDYALQRGIHADRVGLVFTRVYTELKGITDEMDKQISRVLAQGMVDGRGPMEIARTINDRIERIGITRARTLARTEVIGAHAEATLNGFTEAGIDGVEVEAEWATAADGKVCVECSALDGRVFSISEARGMLPVHPNCRCAWLPKVIGGTGIELR